MQDYSKMMLVLKLSARLFAKHIYTQEEGGEIREQGPIFHFARAWVPYLFPRSLLLTKSPGLRSGLELRILEESVWRAQKMPKKCQNYVIHTATEIRMWSPTILLLTWYGTRFRRVLGVS